MKQNRTILIFSLLALISFGACQQETKQSKTLLESIVQELPGEYNNFQQVWQENTQEAIHQVNTSSPHQHVHSIIERLELPSTDGPLFLLKHQKGRDSSDVFLREIMHFRTTTNEQNLYADLYADLYTLPKGQSTIEQLTDLKTSPDQLEWASIGKTIQGTSDQSKRKIQLNGDTLTWIGGHPLLENEAGEDYQFQRCRFFSGWIQYPLPDIPDSTYRQANLRIHDQGDLVQLKLPNGTVENYTIELTQLVYGKTIAIMKLAVYDQAASEVAFNSRSISYTWTSPKAKRIGINLRKIVSGWTLIEPGYINSNNRDLKK